MVWKEEEIGEHDSNSRKDSRIDVRAIYFIEEPWL
jgi:hypothetical protein